MRAADFCGVNVAVGVLLESSIILTKHKTGKDNSFIAARPGLQTVDVVFRIRRITHDQQTVSSPDFLKCLDHEMCVVLRLEP